MKKLISFPILAALVLFTGCQSIGEPDIARISLAVREAATLGTAEAVRDHPDWVVYFTTTRDQLAVLATKDALTVADLLDAIAKLPVSELSSDTARLVITGARLTIAIANWSDVEIVKTAQLRPVILAMSEGITAGLSTLPTPASKAQLKHYKAK